MRLTRHKQFLYDGGIQVPLIIADFRKDKELGAGVKNTNLVSGLDLGTSSLSLANIPIPKYMEGQNIFDPSAKLRDYVISTRDRCDFTIDRIRSVRTKKFKYIRNFMTDRPYLQQTYMDFDNVPFVKVMKQLAKENKLNTIQATFASEERPSEELYNIEEDPFEINNLANDINHTSILKEYATILDQWIIDTDDKGQYPENEEGLKLMLGIWGEHAINPEYESLRKKYPNLAGSLVGLKSASFKKFKLNN
jgi:arylsulfatase A-like enzyme